MILKSDFRPPWYLKNAHLQTLLATKFSPKIDHQWSRERVELPDGDFVDLDWGKRFDNQPLVLILHGLEGSSESPYAMRLGKTIEEKGWNCVVLNFRGCSGEPNRKTHSYCAGCTEDIDWISQRLRREYPDQPLYIVGYSLGGNALLKWLGETQPEHPDAAIAISVPYRLGECAKRLEKGLSRMYEQYLLRQLKQSVRDRARQVDMPIDLKQLPKLKSFYDFDDQVTAPLHGYLGVEDYYGKSSAWRWLTNIEKPTLLIHALDDPFMFPATAPAMEELSPSVDLELTEYGGHVGFISDNADQRFWLEGRIISWLETQLDYG